MELESTNWVLSTQSMDNIATERPGKLNDTF